MKKTLKFSLVFLLVFIVMFTSVGNVSYSLNLPNKSVWYPQRGQAVQEIQNGLNLIGYNLSQDGIYGKSTRNAVIDFQRKTGNLIVDGIYGPKTKIEMLKKLDMPNNEGPKTTEPVSEDVGRIAYLTFDDGPSRTVTPEILKVLNQYNIKATFFVLGTMAEESPHILKEIVNNGHVLGNHGYSHKYDVIYKNMDNFLGEVSSTDRILKQILGQDFTTDLFRFPGGSFEAYKNPYIDAAKNRGYRIYDWNVLNGDAEALNVPKDVLITNLKTTESNVKSGNIIVLMHDGYGKETTVEALPTIIEYLINKGYTFRTL